MLIEKPSIVNYEVDRKDLEILLNRAKLLKSNIIVHSKTKSVFFGLSQDYQDANVLKILIPNEKFTIEHLSMDFPNIACYAKDINALLVANEKTNDSIFIETTNFMGKNDAVLTMSCNTEKKLCFDYFNYEKRYERIINTEIPNAHLLYHYEDIKNTIEVFNKALSAKADEGIKRFAYNDFVYFIPPTFIKSVKSDIIDLNVYELTTGKANTALLEFIIKRKKVGEIRIIYRTHIL